MENKPNQVRDPVCGMMVDPSTSKFQAVEGSQTFYFCSGGCQSKFLANPSAYIKQAPRPAVAGVIYTCPMHPQIRQTGPGNCPICGMTLEPVKATADVGENRELVDMTRRFWVGLAPTLPVFILEMGGPIPALGLDDLLPPPIS